MITKINPENCVQCGNCADICPSGAIEIKNAQYNVNTELCIGCGTCISSCPNETIDFVGCNDE